MNLIDIKQVNKGPIKLTFTLAFPQLGLSIRDVKLMDGKNGTWVSFPSREYTDAEGKKRYYSYVVITDDKKQAFEAKCKELLMPYLAAAPLTPPATSEIPF